MEIQVKQKRAFPLKIISYFMCAIAGLLSGSFAYLHIPDFLQISSTTYVLKQAMEILWTTTMAATGTLAGLVVKYWWDQRGKRIMHRWMNKNKRR